MKDVFNRIVAKVNPARTKSIARTALIAVLVTSVAIGGVVGSASADTTRAGASIGTTSVAGAEDVSAATMPPGGDSSEGSGGDSYKACDSGLVGFLSNLGTTILKIAPLVGGAMTVVAMTMMSVRNSQEKAKQWKEHRDRAFGGGVIGTLLIGTLVEMMYGMVPGAPPVCTDASFFPTPGGGSGGGGGGGGGYLGVDPAAIDPGSLASVIDPSFIAHLDLTALAGLPL